MTSIENNPSEKSKDELQNENTNSEQANLDLNKKLNEGGDYLHSESAEEDDYDFSHLSIEDLVKESEKIINSENAGSMYKKFSKIRSAFNIAYQEELERKKENFLSEGGNEENFEYSSPLKSKFDINVNIFKEKQENFLKKLEQEHSQNLIKRRKIIENLKNLYTNADIGTNLFKAIREIKEEWNKAGAVAKSEFKTLNNDYFHHLNQFYQILDLNKEYREQEYAHNLDKRKSIIARAKELLHEPVVQKAMNELQYLHKIWKEEAGPVAEEFRESTWEEFKTVSDLVHKRKIELSEQLEAERMLNLEKKNKIIEEINKISNPKNNVGHSYWQNSIKKVDDLRNQFIKIGSVPRNFSSKNWLEFKETVRKFNSVKNNFYRELKKSQQDNLEKKLSIIQTARENKDSKDWEVAVPLFKKLQQEWKNIGNIPRLQSDKTWNEFKDICNYFFENFRKINGDSGNDDNWEENYIKKKNLLNELKQVAKIENSSEIINKIKNEWDSIGKVPHRKISINKEFNKLLREKMKLNNMKDYELSDGNLSISRSADKARSIKNQITDLESEIAKLQNNLAFFNNPVRENPLLKNTFDNLDRKNHELSQLKIKLHHMISSHEQQSSEEN